MPSAAANACSSSKLWSLTMWHHVFTRQRTCGYSRSSSTRTAISGATWWRTADRVRSVDAFLAVASKREVRRYAERPIAPETERRILEAGRVTGSSKNRQPWRFVVLSSRETVERAAEAVWAADNVLGAALVIAVVVRGKGPVSFDCGRAAQNMMLTAWNEGVGSCPNGIADAGEMRDVLGLDDEDHFAIVLSFGYPAGNPDPSSRPPE